MKHIYLSLMIAALSSAVNAQTGNVGIGTTTPGSKLTVNGSFAAAYTPVTANTYAAGENDYSIRWIGTADGTITLPASNTTPARTGRLYFIKNASTAYILTIDGNGSELIDNGTIISIQPGESALLTKTDNNTAAGTTYMVMQISQTQQPYMYTITSAGLGAQAITQGTRETLNLNTVEYSTNGGGDFNAATDSWTCPQSGWYRIEATAQATATNSNSHLNLEIQKNATLVGSNLFYTPTGVSNSSSTSKILTLVQGDVITISGYPCIGCGSPSTSVTTRQIEISRM